MSSRKVHDRASMIAAAPAGVIAMIITKSFLWGLAVATGCVLGILLTPDLDQEEAHMSPGLKLLSMGIHLFLVVLTVIVILAR